ncbi:hypothetical protein K504DRAFT_467892 [Pleomassaria siparia CBS 279.74]|uniref:Zn(2)-C6 fungal-type domain-containing protein n=1 Tax=Pleomassaria siparia CBS 279.74 TaxID=1314801 RepID=A0A6G1K6Z2_9PLEO|nr:hypothetical protein K504DRAFT_467892 [Pleomassaria siparia CBS 279.74]
MENRDEMDTAVDGTKIQRACDLCRSRKIRCDRATPCSNCRASKLACITTAPTQKAQKQRIHISDEYEKKIDRIEDRLAGIEQVLENLASKLGNLDMNKDSTEQSSQTRSRSSKMGRSPNSTTVSDVLTGGASFEGETTFNTQSEFARDLLEQAVGNTPSIVQNPDIKAALTSLQDMVVRQDQKKSTSNVQPQPSFTHAIPDVDPAKLERPPWKVVEEVLNQAAEVPTMCFSIVFPFLSLHNQRAIFKETFDFPNEASTARRVNVYGVLYNLFMEFACYPATLSNQTSHHRKYAKLCQIQMETAMSQLPLVLAPIYENVLALLLAGAYSIELSKPSLCWAMVSNAMNLCQSLGYHRYSTMADDSDEQRTAKLHAFWFLYMLDKNLSLRLGRAASFQDWDMSLPYPQSAEVSHLKTSQPVTRTLVYWIKVAQIQGSTYELLFSPAAFHKSAEERSRISETLVKELDQAWAAREELKLEFPKSYGDVGDLFYHADVATHFSTASLIQRAASPDNVTFSAKCLESARASLLAHQRASEKFNIKGNEELWSGYIHWSILQAPFTPFIVIFSNVITHCDPTDLASLSSFVSSMESCRTVSEGADKIYKMCYLFLQVAKIYVEAKRYKASQIISRANHPGFYGTASTDAMGFDSTTMTQFDPYLSALGLVPNATWPMAPSFPPMPEGIEGFAPGLDGSAGAHNSVQDWFSGSRYIIGLMEEDIHMPDMHM